MLERVTGNVFFRLLSEFLYYHNGTPHLTSSLLSFLVCSGGETQANRTHTQREENIASCLFSFSCQIGVCFQGIFFPRAVLYIVCSLKYKKKWWSNFWNTHRTTPTCIWWWNMYQEERCSHTFEELAGSGVCMCSFYLSAVSCCVVFKRPWCVWGTDASISVPHSIWLWGATLEVLVNDPYSTTCSIWMRAHGNDWRV